MATRRSTRSKAAEPQAVEAEATVVETEAVAEAPAEKPAAAAASLPAMKPEEVARFLGLKEYKLEQMQALLNAATAEAQNYLGVEVPADKQDHKFQQGVLHLAAKFYATGTSQVEGPQDIPAICRYFFELVRRELSGSAQ